jgi:hypothetical protein
MLSTELERTPEVTKLTRFYVFLNGKVIVHAMAAYVEVELQLHLLSNLVLDRDEWLALHYGRFISWESAVGVH